MDRLLHIKHFVLLNEEVPLELERKALYQFYYFLHAAGNRLSYEK